MEKMGSKLDRLSDAVDEIRGLIVKKKTKKVRNLIYIIVTIMFVFVNSSYIQQNDFDDETSVANGESEYQGLHVPRAPCGVNLLSYLKIQQTR